jgi:hypothetical protein
MRPPRTLGATHEGDAVSKIKWPTLPDYRPGIACPKCGHQVIGGDEPAVHTAFHRGATVKPGGFADCILGEEMYRRYETAGYPLGGLSWEDDRHEHLDRRCNRCGFAWAEKTYQPDAEPGLDDD